MSSVEKGRSLEQWWCDQTGRLDAWIARRVAGRGFAFRVAAASLLLSLLTHTPIRSVFRDVNTGYVADMFRFQIAHPFTPFDPHDFHPPPGSEAAISHFDKVTFRLAIPLLGRLAGTGAASVLVFTCIGGLLLLPMIASMAERTLGDRVAATYATFALAMSGIGMRLFSESLCGDGFAWCALMATMAIRHPAVAFAGTLAAAFTDERGLIASSATVTYWLSEIEGAGDTPAARSARRNLAGIVAAWVAYFALRAYLRANLRTRNRNLRDVRIRASSPRTSRGTSPTSRSPSSALCGSGSRWGPWRSPGTGSG